jgi:hypothetical protein
MDARFPRLLGPLSTTSWDSVRRVTRFSYPQHSWEEFGGKFLDHHTYLKPKGRGDHSMCEKRWCSEDV